MFSQITLEDVTKSKAAMDFVLTALKSPEMEVFIEYEKVDGSVRMLNGTVAEQCLPEEYRGLGYGESSDGDTMRVFDIENYGWRTFRWSKVKKVYCNYKIGYDLNK